VQTYADRSIICFQQSRKRIELFGLETVHTLKRRERERERKANTEIKKN